MLETHKPLTASLEDTNLSIVSQYPASPETFLDMFPMAELSNLNNTDLSFLDIFFPEDNQCYKTKEDMDTFECVKSNSSAETNVPSDNWLSRNMFMDTATELNVQLFTTFENAFDLGYSDVSPPVPSDTSEPIHHIANSPPNVYAVNSPSTEIESLECCGSSWGTIEENSEISIEPSNSQNMLSPITDSDEMQNNTKDDENLASKKYLHMRKQNNLASQRSRKLRKQKNAEMGERLKKLKIENEQLEQLVVKMERERDLLKELLLKRISKT